MFKTFWENILKLFGKKASQENIANNNSDVYIEEYEKDDELNITAVISSKLAKYTYFKSEIGTNEDNLRALEINDVLKLMWKDKLKIVSRVLGTGGVVLYPFLDKSVLDYTIISQDRVYINKKRRGKIIDATILADVVQDGTKTYYLWTDLTVKDNIFTYRQRATLGDNPIRLKSVKKWEDYEEEQIIKNVDRVLFGYIKSPVDNRKTNGDYGVPITYGVKATIKEIKDHLKKIIDEYGVKDAFVGVDVTMFNQDKNGNVSLPTSKLWKKLNSGKDDFFEIFSPEIRETAYYVRLKELWTQLETEIGLSDGTLTTMPAFTTATQFRKAMFDTLQIVQETQDNIEDGIEDFVYSCNVLLNYGNVTPLGEFTTYYNWSEALTEDNQQIFNNDITMMDKGLKSKAEVRASQTGETVEEAQEKIDEIKANEPSVADLLGNSNE